MLRRTVVLFMAAAGLASASVPRSPAEEALAPGRFFIGGPAVASIGTSAGQAGATPEAGPSGELNPEVTRLRRGVNGR